MPVFVFGSNTAGKHGKGAALYAMKEHGAVYGVGRGYQGNSYAIPTKDRYLKTLELKYINAYVEDFLKFAEERKDLIFQLTPIGCGLAGYEPKDIAPMFLNWSMNILLPQEFSSYLHKNYNKDYLNRQMGNINKKYPEILKQLGSE